MQKIKTSLATSLVLITVLGSQSVIAQVKSKSPEEFVQYGREDAYFAFTATCSDDAKRVIQRKTDGNEWCAKDISGFCDENKDSAADKACSSEFALALGTVTSSKREAIAAKEAEAQNARAAQQEEQKRQAQAAQQQLERQRAAELERERAQALAAAQTKARAKAKATQAAKNKLAIEEELLRIEEEQLELRKQEIELEQRAAEIANKLGKK